MATTEKIFDNGLLVSPRRDTPHPDVLLRSNYVYAAINTIEHEPLYLGEHLRIAVESYATLYGCRPAIDTEEIRTQIKTLLRENNMPQLGNIVIIYIIPGTDSKSGTPEILISWERSTLYKGYELISLRPKAILANYEIPFSAHRTAVSLTTSDYMASYATAGSCHIAIHINRNNRLVSCGDYPLFMVKNGTVFTPPAPDIATDNVERNIMFSACKLAGIPIEERELTTEDIPTADEIMIFNHTGIQSVLCVGEHYYYNLTAQKLEKVLPQITSEGLTW